MERVCAERGEVRIIQVLQIGLINWTKFLHIPEGIEWTFIAAPQSAEWIRHRLPVPCDVFIADSPLQQGVVEQLEDICPAHACFYTAKAIPGDAYAEEFLRRKSAAYLEEGSYLEFVRMIPKKYFRKRYYGYKRSIDALEFKEGLTIFYDGHVCATIEGEFGDTFTYLASWRYNFPVEASEGIELWQEYTKSDSIRIKMIVREIIAGSPDHIDATREFDGELGSDEPILIQRRSSSPCVLAITFMVKGSGTLKFGPLHIRDSRYGAGVFIPGGKRHLDTARQEVMSYFDPMDGKPPLNVYFSGYRSAEGFEGERMMRKFGAPFMLICDPRLEGGAYYVGSESLERQIDERIRDALTQLGFSNDQLILSGLSMGTYGALFYGAGLRPHAMILGKPIANLGTVAENVSLIRPDESETSLDVLLLHEDGLEKRAAERLNNKLWSKFDSASFYGTQFAIAYMLQDDYDVTAYEDIRQYLIKRHVRVFGKGLTGRHNDNSFGISEWFVKKYMEILLQDFHRRPKGI